MELLQYLALSCDRANLSDLSFKVHEGRYPIGLRKALRAVNASLWSPKEWQEAVLYITQESVTADSADGYRDLLCTLVEKHPARSRIPS